MGGGIGGAVVAAASAPDCTRHLATPHEANSARPGDVVCFDGDISGDRLVITKGGTPREPVTYSGRGAAVHGITIEADNVVVEGYRTDRPEAPGIELTGDHITVRNNTVTGPRGGDGDGIRFFGNDLKIVSNTVSRTDNRNGHADCMQTFASDSPPSRHVLIEGNRCRRVDNMCLMAEGPNDEDGDGKGSTSDITVRNNYCETLTASQALMFEDVRNATIEGNTFAAPTHHAIGLAHGSTGAHVGGNELDPGIGYEVGIDASSMAGYEGPEPGGEP
ncbi:right-handed parallel beta-helix repeat-containing protein [Streptomyces sp. 205]|uniref:Right-handed parallel beta-helix repeat-containing protein n=2 Tax=Streptomyces coffeae TaxID=621382 RepID=A0ABS1NMU4_9ACTN|nr:right-handed parallel beta-helix repeat-containing protein [Streptomyces coffeae]